MDGVLLVAMAHAPIAIAAEFVIHYSLPAASPRRIVIGVVAFVFSNALPVVLIATYP